MALEKEHLAEATQVPKLQQVPLSLPGFHLCSATLCWLLAENAAVDVLRAQALSSIQGIAPDGTDVNLIVHEVSRGYLSVLGETDLRAHCPQWVPGPLLMKSYFNWPISLVKIVSQGEPALSNPVHHVFCFCALLGSHCQWTMNAVTSSSL